MLPLSRGDAQMTKTKKVKAAAPDAVAPKKRSKDTLIDLLRRAGGTSIGDIVSATGWQPHSARAALTGLRKSGFELAKEKSEEGTRYTIAAEPAA
jgi:hypothetical protein